MKNKKPSKLENLINRHQHAVRNKLIRLEKRIAQVEKTNKKEIEMKNVISLEDRVSNKRCNDDRYTNSLTALKEKLNAQQGEMTKTQNQIDNLLSQWQHLQDEAAGLDILAKVKQGKFVIVDLETMAPVEIKFM